MLTFLRKEKGLPVSPVFVLITALFGLDPEAMQTEHQFPPPLTGVSAPKPDAIQQTSAAVNSVSDKPQWMRRWRLQNRDRLKAYMAQYRKTHSERLRRQQKIYRSQHINEYNAWSKARYRKLAGDPAFKAKARAYRNRPGRKAKKRAYDLEYRERNKDRLKQRSIEYSKTHSAEVVARVKKWALKNQEKVKAYRNAANARRGNLRKAAPKSVKRVYAVAQSRKRLQCYYCGTPLKTKREVDHVMPVAKNGPHEAGNLAISCKACNREKSSKLLGVWQPPTKQPLLPL